MNIAQMHYEFKDRLNKVDSTAYSNFIPQQVDVYLNAAQDVFIHRLAEPIKNKFVYGIERNQRIIDELSTLVVDQEVNNSCIATTPFSSEVYTVPLPEDYMFYMGAFVLATKQPCEGQRIRVYVQQHDDVFRDVDLIESSFEWRIVNGEFNEHGMLLFSDGTFSIDRMCYSYLRRPAYMSYPTAVGGSYTLPDGVTVINTVQDCELPVTAHSEIVDLAVLLAKGSIETPGMQYSQYKVSLSSN